MKRSPTYEYVSEVYTRDHRILLARIASSSFLLNLIDEKEKVDHILVQCVQSIFAKIQSSTECFLKAYEKLGFDERVAVAFNLEHDPLKKEKAYFGSLEEANQKFFVWPYIRMFYSEKYSDFITSEWCSVLPLSSRGRIWCQTLIKQQMCATCDEEMASHVRDVDLYEKMPDFTSVVVPELNLMIDEYAEPLRFVTRRFNIGRGVPAREDTFALESFDFSNLNFDDFEP